MTPAATPTARARLYPTALSPLPKAVTAPNAMTISPAAGPLMVNSESERNVVRIPPMIAVKIPAIGGYPLASEMPRQSGNAIKNTRKPESRSLLQ